MSVSEFPLLSLIRIYVIPFRAHKKDKNKFFLSVALTWLYLLLYKVIHLSLGVYCSVTKWLNSLWPHRMQLARLPFVLHHCPEFVQTHVHWVSDALWPSHPLSTPSPPAFNLSQPQGFFQWVSSSHQLAEVLELQLQSFQWQFRTDFLYDWLVWSPCSPRDSQESSPAPQFESITCLVLSLLYGPTLTSVHDYWKNHSFD